MLPNLKWMYLVTYCRLAVIVYFINSSKSLLYWSGIIRCFFFFKFHNNMWRRLWFLRKLCFPSSGFVQVSFQGFFALFLKRLFCVVLKFSSSGKRIMKVLYLWKFFWCSYYTYCVFALYPSYILEIINSFFFFYFLSPFFVLSIPHMMTFELIWVGNSE